MIDRRTITPDQKLMLKYYIYVALILVLGTAPLLLLALIPGVGWIYLLIVVLGTLLWLVPAAILIPLYYRSIEYELDDDELLVRRGVITKTETTVPYRTVTNIDVKRGIWDRLLGLGTLSIHTAGFSQQAGAEAILPGLVDYDKVYTSLRTALHRYRARAGQAVGVEEMPAALEEGIPPTETVELLQEILGELRALRDQLGRGD